MSSPATSRPATAADQATDDADARPVNSGRIGAAIREHLALAVFAVLVVAGGVALLSGLGDYHWFRNDEWYIFTQRSLTDPGSWFESHNGHLIALPTVVLRTLFEVFGLDYTPYFVTVVLAHLVLVCLIRWVMRRAGVGPWIATVGAAPLILFGAGAQNIVWGFQIAFVLPLVFGIAQGVLADQTGPLNRRDWLGLAFGAAAILCSAVGLVMVAVAGITAMLRRGWRAALFHMAPLATIYVVWAQFVADDDDVYIEPARVGRWVLNGEIATFEGIAQSWPVALLIVAVLATGLALRLWSDGLDALRRQAALPIAMLVSSPMLFTMVALGRGRALFESIVESERFVYVGAALTLPALAVAVQALTSLRRELALLIALPLFGIPGNLAGFEGNFVFNRDSFAKERAVLFSLASAPLHDVDGKPDPLPEKSPPYPQTLTLTWLLQMRAEGKVPDRTQQLAPEVERAVPVMLAISQRDQALPPEITCGRVEGPLELTTVKGEQLGLVEAVRIRGVGGGRTLPVTYNPEDGALLEFQRDGLELSIKPVTERPKGWQICRG